MERRRRRSAPSRKRDGREYRAYIDEKARFELTRSITIEGGDSVRSMMSSSSLALACEEVDRDWLEWDVCTRLAGFGERSLLLRGFLELFPSFTPLQNRTILLLRLLPHLHFQALRLFCIGILGQERSSSGSIPDFRWCGFDFGHGCGKREWESAAETERECRSNFALSAPR